MHDSTLKELEEKSLNEDDSSEVPPADIVAYNELRSCADLFRMKTQGILDIQPEFQREVVWKGPDQSRFIDSLIKQLPIPSMCFAMDHKAQKWIVIDGLQRISTIVRFLEGGDWTISDLDDIDPGLAGKSVAAMKLPGSSLHHYYTRVENLSIPVTVLRCDLNKKNHTEFLFTIFHRLNTGGMKLNNQEIRNCIFSGSLNDLLKAADEYPAWRKLNKMKPRQSYRFTKQEIILRFLALHDGVDSYEGHLAKFLNTYMHDHRHADQEFIQRKQQLFRETVDCVTKKAFGANIPKLSLTVLEAVLIGVSRNLDLLRHEQPAVVAQRFQSLVDHNEFSEASLKEGLSKKPRVVSRLQTAARIFAGTA
jgi:hypothetical protein